jgi:tRNA G18 (ribose-2'-O)-methylase SpoU
MSDFTQVKFQQMPIERQHKKCAELLRKLYDASDHKALDYLLEQYTLWRGWMGISPFAPLNKENISNCYHWHMQHARQSVKEHRLLPSIKTQDRLIAEPHWPIAIYFDRIRSAHNVGSILRTIEAYSLGTAYFAPQTPFIDHKQVQDASMGASQWVECRIETSLDKLPHPIIALETSTRAISLHEFIFPPSFTLAIGNEEYGCSEQILYEADYLVEIPLRGRKNSLNVANAFAIAAAEIARQRSVIIIPQTAKT